MRNLILAAAAVALLAAPAYATKKNDADAPAATTEKTKAAPKYDCTKKGNANKAACKDAVAAAAPAATPAPVAKPAPATPAAKPTPTAAAAPTKAAGTSKMSICAKQWHTLTDAQKADWKTKGAAMKSKKGKPLNDYQAFSSDCMKK